jgi:glyoxylase-like metal-dependent hydrolase (beta-lactamase superfamily II)
MGETKLIRRPNVNTTVIQTLYESPPHTLPFAPDFEIRAFVLPRADGNLLVYSAPELPREAGEINDLGGISRQYLNHWHEAMFLSGDASPPLHVHEGDRAPVEERRPVAATFAERGIVGDDFELIPMPGHTPGATAFLWDSGEWRYLFTGDSIYLRGDKWIAAVLESSDRAAYLDSLEMLRDVEFDVLVPWAATAGDPYFVASTHRDAQRRIDAIIARLRAGGDA